MDIKALIYSMLTENTGVNFLDSGGKDGRHWQQNQRLTPQAFEEDPAVKVDYNPDYDTHMSDIYPVVSLYHYLPTFLHLDDLCIEFNQEFPVMGDWDSNFHGTSEAAAVWLENHGLEPVGRSFYSYNYDNVLSQDINCQLMVNYADEYYLLLQIHNGADARGGLTDAKLFYMGDEYPHIDFTPDVMVWGRAEDGEPLVELDYRSGRWVDPDNDADCEDEPIPADVKYFEAELMGS